MFAKTRDKVCSLATRQPVTILGMKSLLSYTLIVFTTILLFDVSLFFVLPAEYALDFNGYRENFNRDTRPPNNPGTVYTPKDYFVKR